MLGERITSQSEVIRAISSGFSPCCGVSHRAAGLSIGDEVILCIMHARCCCHRHDIVVVLSSS